MMMLLEFLERHRARHLFRSSHLNTFVDPFYRGFNDERS